MMMNVLNPQSRRAMLSGVPSNADIASLSKTASEGSGATSGISWKPGESRRNQGRTSSGEATRCQAIAMRSWNAPISSFGSDMWRVKKIRTPASRAARSTWTTFDVIAAPSFNWRRMPTCMS